MLPTLRNPLIPRLSLDHVTYPEVKPVPEGVQRPFWSVIIPTYNRPEYLPITLRSVLDQAPGPDEMQIIVVDNASTVGDIEALVHDVGGGRVEYYRQSENVGFARNFTTGLNLARGHWIHQLPDDDLALPGCYDAYRQHIETYGCPMVFSQTYSVDKAGEIVALSEPVPTTDGVLDDPLRLFWQMNTFAINTLVASRELFEQVGGWSDQIYHGCDVDLSQRMLNITGCIGFLPEAYIATRYHDQQASQIIMRKDGFTKKELTVWQVVLKHQDTARNRANVYNNLGLTLYNVSRSMIPQGFNRLTLKQAWWAFRLYPRRATLGNIVGMLYTWTLQARVQRARHFSRRVLRFAKRKTRRLLGLKTTSG